MKNKKERNRTRVNHLLAFLMVMLLCAGDITAPFFNQTIYASEAQDEILEEPEDAVPENEALDEDIPERNDDIILEKVEVCSSDLDESLELFSDEAETNTVTLTLVYDPVWQYIGVGTPDVTIEIAEGTMVDLEKLEIPGHEDEAKVSWCEESGNMDTVISSPFVMDSDKTIYAGQAISGSTDLKETEESAATTPFYLSYHSNGGSPIKARKFTEPTEVDFDDPTYIPTWDGHTFTGWYTDFDLATRLNGTVEVSDFMTVVAGWEFHLNYESNGGTVFESRTFTELTKPTIIYFADEDYIPTREGYTFTGWYKDSDLTTKLDAFGSISKETTIYAGWEKETKNVTLTLVYDPVWQILEIGTPDVKIPIAEGTEVNLETLTIPGHENDAKISWYEESGDISTLIKSPFVMNSDKTIYAGTTIGESTDPPKTEEPVGTTPFELSYDSNGGSDIQSRKFTEATDVNFDDPDYIPTLEGYTFTGWYADKDLVTRLNGTVKVSDSMTVYAGWKEETKKVTLTLVYDPVWQVIGVGTPDVKIDMTEGTEVDLETLEIPGHEDDAKVSWYEESGDVSTVIKSPFVMNSDKTIYAGASIGGSTGPKETETEEPAVTKPFYLSYNTNGGSYINTRKFTETTAVDFEDENYIPTREGYIFTGWYTTSDLQTRLTGKVDVSKDMTVWAGWKLKTVETERQTEPTTESAAKSATESTTKSATESETESETESTTDSTIDSTTKSATGDKIRAASARATNSSDSGTESPKTGDQSNLNLWFVLLLISGLEIIVTMICKKRHAGR